MNKPYITYQADLPRLLRWCARFEAGSKGQGACGTGHPPDGLPGREAVRGGTGDSVGDWEQEKAGQGTCLAPHLPGAAVGGGAGGSAGNWERKMAGGVVFEVGLHLAAVPRQALACLWGNEREGVNLLRALVRRTRADLLADLHILASVIVALGREEAMAETFRAIQDVRRWRLGSFPLLF